jgi:hypothetical protein
MSMMSTEAGIKTTDELTAISVEEVQRLDEIPGKNVREALSENCTLFVITEGHTPVFSAFSILKKSNFVRIEKGIGENLLYARFSPEEALEFLKTPDFTIEDISEPEKVVEPSPEEASGLITRIDLGVEPADPENKIFTPALQKASLTRLAERTSRDVSDLQSEEISAGLSDAALSATLLETIYAGYAQQLNKSPESMTAPEKRIAFANFELAAAKSALLSVLSQEFKQISPIQYFNFVVMFTKYQKDELVRTNKERLDGCVRIAAPYRELVMQLRQYEPQNLPLPLLDWKKVLIDTVHEVSWEAGTDPEAGLKEIDWDKRIRDKTMSDAAD